MEARNYGLKFLFDTPISIDDLKVVEFMIYQPLNVIGKDTDDLGRSRRETRHLYQTAFEVQYHE